MSLLKERIMESAIRFFAEKGYSSTSILDIANDCGISKGSVYKFFDSKEDLLMEVYGSRVRDMYDAAEKIKSDATLRPRDRFVRETEHQLQYFASLKFSIEEYQDLPSREEGKLVPFCHCLRARQLDYYRECLLAAYGSRIDSRIWDLVAAYGGILKEYTQFPVYLHHPLNLENAAAFIVDRMDDMAHGTMERTGPPILPAAVLNEYVSSGLNGTSVPAAKRISDIFDTLLSAADELPAQNSRKAELLEAAEVLREEAEKEQPKKILIRALIEFLQSQPELASIVGQLNKLIGQSRGNSAE